MNRLLSTVVTSLFLVPAVLTAQHNEQTTRQDLQTSPYDITVPKLDPVAPTTMSSTTSPSLSMTRDGSGTSWHPDATPVSVLTAQSGNWSFMLDGNAYIRYTNQNLTNHEMRGGDSRIDAPNWVLGAAQRRFGSSDVATFRSRVSLEPFTESKNGYPLVGQTGEVVDDRPVVDRQAPHDLVSELSVTYAHGFSQDVDGFVYFGLPGQPALGPSSYIERPSAMNNPNAPLSHHWQDATEITYGVATAGLRVGMVRVDGSIFNGRERDDEHLGFDTPRFNSYSGRLSVNPIDQLAIQASYGFVRSPEALMSAVDEHRTTASVMYNVPTLSGRTWATTFIWGMNRPTIDGEMYGEAQNSFALESSVPVGTGELYGRAETVQKSGRQLLINNASETPDLTLYSVSGLTVGGAWPVMTLDNFVVDLGGQAGLTFFDEAVESVYGGTPLSLGVYLRVHPDVTR